MTHQIQFLIPGLLFVFRHTRKKPDAVPTILFLGPQTLQLVPAEMSLQQVVCRKLNPMEQQRK
jgi:hypothetical protein